MAHIVIPSSSQATLPKDILARATSFDVREVIRFCLESGHWYEKGSCSVYGFL